MKRLISHPTDIVRAFRFVLTVFGIVSLLVFGFKAAQSADDITAVGGRAVKTFVSWFSNDQTTEVATTSDASQANLNLEKAVEKSPLPAPTDASTSLETGTTHGATVPSQAPSQAQGTSKGKSAVAPGQAISANAGASDQEPAPTKPKASPKVTEQVRAVLKDALMMP